MQINQDPQILHHKMLKETPPALRYDGTIPFTAWQQQARARLATLLGLDRIAPAEQDEFTLLSTEECEGFTDYALRFQSEQGYFVPCHLWVPKGKVGKLPTVICLQGHSTGYHISMGRPIYSRDEGLISGGDRDFAVQIVKEGYCALCIEQRNFGECSNIENKKLGCTVPSLSALLFGRTTIGERVFDIMRAIDVLPKHFPMINTDAIACMGNSGGGTATIYAAAMEERICLAMPSCALCTYKDSIGAMHHCSCNFVPNIALDFDMGDLCGLIAPRPLIVVSGAQDNIFPRDGVAESVAIAKNYYRAACAPDDACIWLEGTEGHRFYAALSWPTFRKLLLNS